jgi:hypothetical protein
MGYAVELYFDEETTARVGALAGRIHAAYGGIDLSDLGFIPHISLAGYETVAVEKLEPILAELACQTPRFGLQLGAIGLFPTGQGVVYLAPVVTGHLLDLHERFSAQATAAGQTAHPYYQPGNWIPHCSVAHDLTPDQVTQAVRLCLDSQVFSPGQIVAIGLIEYRPVRSLCRFPLAAP